jgi:hypothetical protein
MEISVTKMELVQDTPMKSTRMSLVLMKAGQESASGYGALSGREKQYQRAVCRALIPSSKLENQSVSTDWTSTKQVLEAQKSRTHLQP